MPPVLTLEVESENFKKIERFTIILYDKTSHLTSVNECRNDLFCHMNRSMANFPPTLNFLLQHARRAVYQAGIRTTCKQPQPHIPSRRDFAWTETSGTWEPVWMTIPQVSKTCKELMKCLVKGECTVCKCAKAKVVCSPFCVIMEVHKVMNTKLVTVLHYVHSSLVASAVLLLKKSSLSKERNSIDILL